MWGKFTGWLGRVFRRPTLLKAQEEPVSVIGFLLVVVMSASMVLVFGHVEIFRLFSPDIKSVAVAAISLFVLVASTLAGDITLSKVMRRIGPLRRMQEDTLAAWLVAYSVFILGVEGVTFAVALWAVEQRPAALFSQAPLLPSSGVLLIVQIGLRALMVALTFVMLQVTAAKLPVSYEVAITKARERVGGMMDETLATTTLHAENLGALMAAWGRLNQPMPRRRTQWNAGAIERDEEYARRLQAQTTSVVETFQALTQDRLAVAQVAHEQELAQTRDEAQRQVSAAQERMRQLTETAQRQIAQANAAATQRTLDAVLALVATGSLPDWLIEQRPDLASFSLEALVGARGRGGKGASGGGMSGMTSAAAVRDASPSSRQRAFLMGQGIEPSGAPEGKRGVWLRASDVTALTDATALKASTETAQALIKRLGGGSKIGVALVAPFEPTMRELAQRHLLSDEAAQWWANQTPGTGDVGVTSVERGAESGELAAANITRMRA